ncbi:acetyltransferase [Acinetobacter junii]|jgi:sugar O-acyltransferase (sialic acid O-acetyltransferase NeuD family)|uniref:PglD-related sugar-binding protein n=1 Tax=Acinetobacter junii TaxID=40215 RepID=UPI00143A270F|nr:acetyltransferase [Acinetobacter junii]NKG35991.1 acetyltransferase [Acinetobacter junii]
MNSKHKSNLLVLGAGGFGKAVAEVAKSLDLWSEIFFVDDSWPNIQEVNNHKVISNIQSLEKINLDSYQAIVAVGNNQLRQKWYSLLHGLDIPFASVIDPSAVISSSTKVADGVIIMAGCIIGAAVKIQSGAILNIGTLVDHDVEIGLCAHLGIGVKVTGGKKIAPLSFLKAGTVVAG